MAEQVTLALPSKGALAEPTLAFLNGCGIPIHKPNPRQYTGTIPSIPAIDVLFQRARDVLHKVADCDAHLGITGLDIVHEYHSDEIVIIHDELNYGNCKLAIAVPETWEDVDNMYDLAEVALDFREHKQRNIRIATTYDDLSRRFLHAHNLHHFTLVRAEGAIEAAPTLGYADLIVDLTQTGTTLRENHLKLLPDGIVLESQACLIGNRHALQNNPIILDTVRQLLEFIDASAQGKQYTQVTANIQGDDATVIARKLATNSITRGLQGATVEAISAPRHDEGRWYTATIVIPNEDLLNTVAALRAIGSIHIVTTPVRYAFFAQSPTFDQLLDKLSEE